MKYLLLTTIAAVVLVGCATTQSPAISIHEAARDGNIEAVKQHFASGADVNAKDDAFRATPLNWAAFGGHKEIVELLISEGADMNVKCSNQNTPLDVAIKYKRTEIADLLRKHGARQVKN